MLSCPNCGGNLKFDIPSQQLSCEHCHTLFDPYDFDGKTSDAEESKTFDGDYEVTIFTCPQCGGEILSTDNAAAGFCSFCGASTILYSRISHEKRPNYIIPFQKTKEQCKEAYARRMKHSIFAPKELRDPSYIDSFRGIYMPYWAFYISQKGSLSLDGKKTSRRGDYIITDHYALTGDLDAYYKGLSYDASSSFDDNISEELAPYNLKGMKAFTPAYLSGFYADTSDVDAKVYQGDAEYTASAETTERIASDGTFAGFTMDTIRPEQLHTKTETIDSTMFPVWFLSYRKKDRVAYATVNGQTGLVVADIPIDPKRYLLGSLLLAIPIFALLAWSAFLQPSSLVMTTLLLSLLSIGVYCYECVSIHQKDTGANDRGKMFIQSKKASAADKPKTLKPSRSQPQKRIRLAGFFRFVLRYFRLGYGSCIRYRISTITEPQFFPWLPSSCRSSVLSMRIICCPPAGCHNLTNREVMTVRKIKRILTAFVFCLILSASTIPVCASAVSASNEETGYVYVLDDSADFLTDSQENSLQKQLYDLTAYCNVAFVTTTGHSKSSTEDFAADYFDDVFGPHSNGTIFVIDRCLNEIYLYSDGQAHKIITNSRARSITDNTYTYARDKDYYTCAYKVFTQIETLMQGKRIAEPMRYLCSALLAIVAALFLNLFFALWSSRSHKADRRQVMTGLYAQMQINNPRTQFIRQSRTYSPVSSGSSGGVISRSIPFAPTTRSQYIIL